jgi:hypothetical protein
MVIYIRTGSLDFFENSGYEHTLGATVNQHPHQCTMMDEWLVVRKQFSVEFQFPS